MIEFNAEIILKQTNDVIDSKIKKAQEMFNKNEYYIKALSKKLLKMGILIA